MTKEAINPGRSAQKDRYKAPATTADFLSRGKFCRGTTCANQSRDGLFKTPESFPVGSDICQTCINDAPAVLPTDRPSRPAPKPTVNPPIMAKPSAEIGNLRRMSLKKRLCLGPCGQYFDAVAGNDRHTKCATCRNAERRAKRAKIRSAVDALKPPPKPYEPPKTAPVPACKPAPIASAKPAQAVTAKPVPVVAGKPVANVIDAQAVPAMKIGGLARMVADEVAKQIGPAVAAYLARLGVK